MMRRKQARVRLEQALEEVKEEEMSDRTFLNHMDKYKEKYGEDGNYRLIMYDYLNFITAVRLLIVGKHITEAFSICYDGKWPAST